MLEVAQGNKADTVIVAVIYQTKGRGGATKPEV